MFDAHYVQTCTKRKPAKGVNRPLVADQKRRSTRPSLPPSRYFSRICGTGSGRTAQPTSNTLA